MLYLYRDCVLCLYHAARYFVLIGVLLGGGGLLCPRWGFVLTKLGPQALLELVVIEAAEAIRLAEIDAVKTSGSRGFDARAVAQKVLLTWA